MNASLSPGARENKVFHMNRQRNDKTVNIYFPLPVNIINIDTAKERFKRRKR